MAVLLSILSLGDLLQLLNCSSELTMLAGTFRSVDCLIVCLFAHQLFFKFLGLLSMRNLSYKPLYQTAPPMACLFVTTNVPQGSFGNWSVC